MPRTVSLTWQPGLQGRSGRWRKKYHGKIYYFDGGRGKSDREAYDAAVKKWELVKLQADAAAPRKHQRDYETELQVWDQVLAWSKRHGDTAMAQSAFEKREKLTAGLEAPVLSPLTAEDRFGQFFKPIFAEVPDDLIAEAAQALASKMVQYSALPEMSLEARQQFAHELDGSSLRIQREVWDDRLKTQERRTAVRQNTVEEHVNEFLRFKEGQAEQGEVSLGRVYAIRLHLSHFQEWIGDETTVTDLDGSVLRNYHNKLLETVERASKRKRPQQGKKGVVSWTATTARHYLISVKSFVRWLWEIEAIPALPRVLGHKSKTLKITTEPPAAVTFNDNEIRTLLTKANGRTKLFMLLMLNCGMTQKDVADLQKSEVDLAVGRVVRKRSKTGKFDSVPTVNYLLWPETLRLLKEFMDTGDGGLALSNSNGSPLWSERISENGKYGKTDNIKNAFDRLRKQLKITKSLKSFKKTSSSKLRDNERFNGLEDLFLGHAPQKMSDKHYTTAPQKLLDTATCWLATEYGLESPISG